MSKIAIGPPRNSSSAGQLFKNRRSFFMACANYSGATRPTMLSKRGGYLAVAGGLGSLCA
jgi:hypothetical protein